MHSSNETSIYVDNILLSNIQVTKIFLNLVEISSKMYHFYKVIWKQICNGNMFIHLTVALPAATSCTTHCPLLHSCHYNRDCICISDVSLINLLLPKNIPMQEIIQQSVVWTSYWASLMHLTELRNQQTFFLSLNMGVPGT